MLEIRGLSKSFGGVSIVEDLSMTVEPGDVVALVGDNGAGKTTTLRCIVGTEPPDRGEVLLDGRALDERDPKVRRSVCALLDDFAWFPDMSVAEHLQFLAVAHDADPTAVDDALAQLAIDHVADRLPGSLSSGQTRRFALCEALVRPWEILVLDEPEQRLDVDGRAWLGSYLRDQAESGRSVLMASHDPELMARSGARRVDLGRAR